MVRSRVVLAAAALAVAAGALGCSARADEPVPGPAVRGELPGWRLVWDDEFDGQALDRARWAVENASTFGDANNELACLMDRQANVSVGGGELRLTARREQPPLPCGSNDKRFPAGRDYSSAMISTKGIADWTYGRFEIRATLPTTPGTSQGLWPAFWLRPTDGGDGELDVLEAIGSGPAATAAGGSVTHTLWYDYSGAHPKSTATTRLPAGLPSDGMHVYAVEWARGSIRWFVDGVQTFEQTSGTAPLLDTVFGRPFFLRLNLAVGGSFPGSPTTETVLPAAYAIDYVRVYQR